MRDILNLPLPAYFMYRHAVDIFRGLMRYFRVGKDAGRNCGVVHELFFSKNVLCRYYSARARDMREEHASGNVPYGVNTFYAGFHLIVNLYRVLFNLNANILKPYADRVKTPSDGDK